MGKILTGLNINPGTWLSPVSALNQTDRPDTLPRNPNGNSLAFQFGADPGKPVCSRSLVILRHREPREDH